METHHIVFNTHTPTWTQSESPDTHYRYGHATIAFKNYIITFGGSNGSSALNDIMAFDMQNSLWKSLSFTGFNGTTPTPRYGHTMCLSQNNKAYVFGGYDNINTLNEIGKLTFDINSTTIKVNWETLQTSTATTISRVYHTAHIYQDQLFVFGGYDQSQQTSNQLWSLDLSKMVWTQVQASGHLPRERAGHSSVIYMNKLYVFGGCLSADKSTNRLNDLFVLDLNFLNWQKITSNGLLPGPTSGATAQEADGKIYIFGGRKSEDSYSNELFVYDINKNAFDLLQTNGKLPSQRFLHSSVCIDSCLIIWGGWRSHSKEYFSDIYSLQLDERKNQNYIRSSQEASILKEAFLNYKYSDILLKVEGQEFPAHKLVLAGSCQFFDNMFSSGMKESTAIEIEIPNVKASTFKAFLEFIYCRGVEISEELAWDLLSLSDKYTLLELKEKCEVFLAQNLNENNFVKFARIIKPIQAPLLKEAILQFIKQNLEVVAQREDLYELPKEFLVKVIQKISEK